MSAVPAWHAIAGAARALIEDAAAPLGASVARAYVESCLALWPSAQSPDRAIVATSLAPVRWLPEAAARAPHRPLHRFARQICDAAGALRWRQTYGASEVSAAFLERYAWCELFGTAGPIGCEALACGMLLLGADTSYPSHSHRAEELYLVVSGTADWQRGTEPFAPRPPGALILHAPHEPHAMRTQSEPLLALYLWRGAGLGERAQLQKAVGPPSRKD